MELLFRRNPEYEFPNYLTDAKSDVAFLIPLKAGEKEVGILFLSAKNSRQDFSSGDIFLLQGVTSVAAMALHSTLLIRDVNLRDTFVSIASHELRTPLTSIVGYADLLLYRNPPDEIRKRWVTAILENGKRITGMVDDLLNITRIQSGKFALKIEKAKLSLAILERLSMAKESTTKHEFAVNIARTFRKC